MVATWAGVSGERASIPQIGGPQHGGQRVAAAGPLGLHRAPGCQQDQPCFPEALGSGTDEFGRGCSKKGPGSGDGIDRVRLALDVPVCRRGGLASQMATRWITLRQISNESRGTTGEKWTASYQAIGVGRLLPGAQGGQIVYESPGGSDMNGVTHGGPESSLPTNAWLVTIH